MSSTVSGLNLEMENKGYIITTDENRTPQVVPATNGFCGFETHQELLFVFAMDVLYKFKCEDFQVRFDGTRKFIATHYQKKTLQTNPWFKTPERKLLDNDPQEFYLLFKRKLCQELKFYHGVYAAPLVTLMLAEIEKITLPGE